MPSSEDESTATRTRADVKPCATNQGPGRATAVVLTTQLPASFSYNSTNCSGGTSSRNGNAVSCHFVSLDAGATVSGTLIATPTLGGTHDVPTVSAANEPDADPATNNASTTTMVRAVDLASFSLEPSSVSDVARSVEEGEVHHQPLTGAALPASSFQLRGTSVY